jgi:hypothetical protein
VLQHYGIDRERKCVGERERERERENERNTDIGKETGGEIQIGHSYLMSSVYPE